MQIISREVDWVDKVDKVDWVDKVDEVDRGLSRGAFIQVAEVITRSDTKSTRRVQVQVDEVDKVDKVD